VKAPSKDKLNRSFGLVMAGGLAVLFLLRWLVAGVWTWWLPAVSAAFLGAALVLPNSLTLLRQGWMKLAAVLGFVNQRILLTVLFAVLITPTAALLRLLGKQPIRLSAEGKASTYWHQRRPEEFTAARMERQF
jgi:hypothetical protein